MPAEKDISPMKDASYDDKYSVEVFTHDRKAFAELVERYLLDLVEAKVTDKYAVHAVVYATEKQIAALKQAKIDIKVGRNQSEIGRGRQKEVSREDRFKGGTIPPKGLGTKK